MCVTTLPSPCRVAWSDIHSQRPLCCWDLPFYSVPHRQVGVGGVGGGVMHIGGVEAHGIKVEGRRHQLVIQCQISAVTVVL